MIEDEWRECQDNKILDGESDLERKIDECYKRLDELHGDVCQKIINESVRLGNIYDIDDSAILEAFISDKFYVYKYSERDLSKMEKEYAGEDNVL